MHLDPDCTGYWSPCPDARYLVCGGCAARFEPTPQQLRAALRENYAGLLALRLAAEGALPPRAPRGPGPSP